MEFFKENTDEFNPCEKCGKITWIYILKAEENNEDIQKKQYLCNLHYTELLKSFLTKENNVSMKNINLFPEELHLNELPIHDARLRFGNMPLESMLQNYMLYLNEKIQQSEDEIESFEKQSNVGSDPFISMLQNEIDEKELLKTITEVLIKQFDDKEN